MNNENKLIAEFMGLDAQILSTNNVHSWSDAPFYYITEDSKEKVMEGVSKYSKYHTSWDWLMPVANEIIKSRDEQGADWDLTNLKYALCTTNIEYIYKAVVEFIKNQNN